MYERRFYREWQKEDGLVTFRVVVKETDLWITASSDLSIRAKSSVYEYRDQIASWITRHPEFQSSMVPLPLPDTGCPPIIHEMIRASTLGEVGPMATVAGAIAEFVGRDLSAESEEVIVENGGDIYLASGRERIVGIYAGKKSPFSGKLGLRIDPDNTPLGICASSGEFGHSLSLGKSDVVITVSPSAALADAAATAAANLIQTEDDIQKGIDFGRNIRDLLGIIIIKNDKMGIWGEINLTPTRAG